MPTSFMYLVRVGAVVKARAGARTGARAGVKVRAGARARAMAGTRVGTGPSGPRSNSP